MTIIIQNVSASHLSSGADMGDVIQFIPKSERERIRLIREARAIYDSIFPSNEPEISPKGPEGRNGALLP
jgi:hypothetical protein